MTAATDLYGPGTVVDTAFTPVPEECHRLLRIFASKIPGLAKKQSLIEAVVFEGDDLPCIPRPIKSQAVTSVLHALTGIVGHQILRIRGVDTSNQITRINTDHAGLYPGTPALVEIDGVKGHDVLKLESVPVWDASRSGKKDLRAKFRHLSNRNTRRMVPVLRALGIDPEIDCASLDEAYDLIKRKTTQFQAGALQNLIIEHELAGEIVYSPKAWLETAMGKSLAKHPLVNYQEQRQCTHTPPYMPGGFSGDDKRPLADIKVLELARIIAAPAVGAALASMGAEVIRAKSPYTWTLDKETGDRARLWKLIKEADVFLQGYRLRSLERRGFGLNDLVKMASERGRGIVWVLFRTTRLATNCPNAAAGTNSSIMGRAFGFPPGQGVLPSLPISDMSTGILTCLTTMCALRDRAEFGGSYHGHAALAAYDMAMLGEEVRLYKPEIVEKIQDKFKIERWGSDAGVGPLYYMMAEAWEKQGLTSDDKFFSHFVDGPLGKDHKVLGPVVRYDDSDTTPRWSSPPVPFCYHDFRHFTAV